MRLFQTGDFSLHGGLKSHWKIDCDALTNKDWRALALMAKQILPAWSAVLAVPTGGDRFGAALMEHLAPDGTGKILICDDVLTTGGSMENALKKSHMPPEMVVGVVAFARGPCPGWVMPLFRKPLPSEVAAFGYLSLEYLDERGV